MPIVEPGVKHRYTAKIALVVECADAAQAFSTATELVRRVALGGYVGGIRVEQLVILQAEVERIEPEKPRGAHAAT